MRNEFNYLSFLNEDFHPEKAKIIYNSLILEAKKDMILGYTEKHHIIPKCLGGNDYDHNLVCLTYSEHIFAHYLLAIINFPNQNLILPFILMINSKRKQIKTVNDLKVDFTKFALFEKLKIEGYKLQTEKNKKNANIAKANITFKEEFYNKKVLSGRYKKYNIFLNNKLFSFTRKELKEYFENNNIKEYINLYTNRKSSNIKQLINHLERFEKDSLIKFQV